MVIANDHYQSIGIVCLSVIRGLQRVARKRSISFNLQHVNDCDKVITKGGVTYKNTAWHRECFTCTQCARTLAGEKFTSQDDKPYCADCYGELFAKKCDNCMKPITGIKFLCYL